MSVASEINRIKANIASAYDEAEAKGATMPATENSANLADTIGSIPQGGISEDVKSTLLACFEKVAWTDAFGQQYYDALESALNGETPKTLVSISAVCNTQTALVGTLASDLDITVIALYDDQSSAVVSGWATSGTVAEGNNTFTITFADKTAAVSVVGTTTPPPKDKATIDSTKHGGGYNVDGIFTMATNASASAQSVLNTLSHLKTPLFRFNASDIAIANKDDSGYVRAGALCNLKFQLGCSAFANASDQTGNFTKLGYATAFTEAGVPIATGQVCTNYLKGTATGEIIFNIPRTASSDWTNALNGKIYFDIPVWQDNVEDTYIYFGAGSFYPVGYTQGDLIYAGQNTVYAGKDNIND